MVPLNSEGRDQNLGLLKQLESGAGHQKGKSCIETGVQNSKYGFLMSPWLSDLL